MYRTASSYLFLFPQIQRFEKALLPHVSLLATNDNSTLKKMRTATFSSVVEAGFFALLT